MVQSDLRQGRAACQSPNVEEEAKLKMKAPGLLLALSLAMGTAPHAGAVGCEHDMQCKGERICRLGQCVSPASTGPNPEPPVQPPSATKIAPPPEPPARVRPATGNVPPTGQPAKTAPVRKSGPASEQPAQPSAAKSGRTPQQPAVDSPAMMNTPALSTEFRSCCTKIGKLPLDRELDLEDVATTPRDFCRGKTIDGISLPGTPCN